MTRFPFALYRRAWILALPPIASLAALDGWLRRRGLPGIIPRTWRVTERMCYLGARRSPAMPRALWLHCASLGEAKGLWSFALSLADAPYLALTAATDDGAAWLDARCAEIRGTPGPGRRITASIAPFDHPAVLGRFLDDHGALGLCLYEAELWPNALEACRERGLPAALVSGRLTARAQRLYRRFGGAGARLLDGLAWIQAQSPLDRERFVSLTRTEVLEGSDFKAAYFFSGGDFFSGRDSARHPHAAPRYRFAFLSLHYRELLLLLPGLPALMERTPLIVFPRKLRELDRFQALLRPMHFRLHSRDPGARHVLVDSMGRIGDLLPSCHSAFVGGSLIPKGCHNLWEPLLAGCRIHFGPHFGSQESLAERVMARGIGAVLKDPRRIGSLPFSAPVPDPDLSEACDGLVRDLRQGLDSALLEGGRRIFATFYPQAIAGRDRGEKETSPASGKDKGYHR